MSFKRKGWTLIGALLAIPALLILRNVVAFSQIATTTVTETICRADDTPATRLPAEKS